MPFPIPLMWSISFQKDLFPQSSLHFLSRWKQKVPMRQIFFSETLGKEVKKNAANTKGGGAFTKNPQKPASNRKITPPSTKSKSTDCKSVSNIMTSTSTRLPSRDNNLLTISHDTPRRHSAIEDSRHFENQNLGATDLKGATPGSKVGRHEETRNANLLLQIPNDKNSGKRRSKSVSEIEPEMSQSQNRGRGRTTSGGKRSSGLRSRSGSRKGSRKRKGSTASKTSGENFFVIKLQETVGWSCGRSVSGSDSLWPDSLFCVVDFRQKGIVPERGGRTVSLLLAAFSALVGCLENPPKGTAC